VRLHIAAIGRPAPQGSKQLGGAGQLLEQSAYLPAWRQAVKVATWEAYRAAGIPPGDLPLFWAGKPVTIEVCTFFVTDEQCRAEGTDEPIGTPDIDKLLRATLDALGGQRRGSARLFADDSQVVMIKNLSKQRAAAGKPSGAYIVVSDGRE